MRNRSASRSRSGKNSARVASKVACLPVFGEFHENEFDKAAKDFDRAYELDPTLYAGIGKALSSFIYHRQAEALDRLMELEAKIKQRGVGDPEATY